MEWNKKLVFKKLSNIYDITGNFKSRMGLYEKINRTRTL